MPVRCYKNQASIAFNPIQLMSLIVPQVHGNRATDDCRPACCQKKIEVVLVSLFFRFPNLRSATDSAPIKGWLQKRAGGGGTARRRLPRRRRVRGGLSRTTKKWRSVNCVVPRLQLLPFFSQSRLLRLLEVKRSATLCRKYANLARVDPAQMADNPPALVDNRCKAWLDSVLPASGVHPGPEQAAIQGLPVGLVERPTVDVNSIGN